jgi:hypothetical protein
MLDNRRFRLAMITELEVAGAVPRQLDGDLHYGSPNGAD